MAGEGQRIFISYSWQSKTIVNRIYFDLIRSGVSVWKDDKANVKGKEIWSVAEHSIRSSNVFLLMDSASARDSDWVKKECDLAWNLQRAGQINIAVCLVESRANVLKYPELFDQMNNFLYFDFSGIVDYDNSGVYNKSIHELCQFLQVAFTPWTSVPREHDLEREIFFENKLHTEEAETIFRDYEIFSDRYRMGYPSALSRLHNIIADCEFLGIKIISTDLALGVILVNEQKTDLAEQVFLKVSVAYPNDPRGFIGLAGVQGIQDKNEAAVLHYEKAIDLIKLSNNPAYTKHLPEIQISLAEIYVLWSNYNAAESLLDTLSPQHRMLPEARTILACIRMYRDEDPEAVNILEQLLDNVKGLNEEKPSHYLYLLDAYRKFDPFSKSKEIQFLQQGITRFPENIELQVALAQSIAAAGNYESALYRYEQIMTEYGDNMKYKIEAATICHCIVQQCDANFEHANAIFYSEKKKKYIEACLHNSPASAEEHYLLGQAHYLLGDMEGAAVQFAFYERLANGIERFPYYSEVVC